MKKLYGILTAIVTELLVFSLILWPVIYSSPLKAQSTTRVYYGEVVADGNASVEFQGNRRTKIGRYPMPLFDKSAITTVDGSAVISFASDGIVEVHKNSVIELYKKSEINYLNVKKGSASFSIPSKSNLTVILPYAGVVVNEPPKISSAGDFLPPEGIEKAGVAGIDKDGNIIIASFKGRFKVNTADGGISELKGGETMKLSQADTGLGSDFLKELTSSQLNALSAQKDIKVIIGLPVRPQLARGEVALEIPEELGGGFIVGTPDAIASAMKTVGLTVTPSASSIKSAAVVKGTTYGAAGSKTLLVGLGILGAGGAIAAAAGGGGGGGGGTASPSQ